MNQEAMQYPETGKDRTGLLIFGGVAAILLGLLGLLFATGMVAMALLVPAGSGMSLQTMGTGIAMYALGGLLFIVVGIGSIRARRWARALILAIAWMWLAIGVISMAAMAVTMPAMLASMQSQADMPAPAGAVMAVTMAVFLGGLYIVLPLFFILVYQGRNVELTCRRRDPGPSVLADCPLPVRIAGVFFLFGAVGALSMVVMPAAPFGSAIITGWPVALAGFLLASVYLVFGWNTLKLRMWAWWGDLLILIAACAYGVWSFLQVDMAKLFEAMQYPPEQIEMTTRMFSGGSLNMLLGIGGLFAVLMFVYLLYIRRYFPETKRE